MILRLRHTVSNERRHRQPAAGNACCSKSGSGILIPDPLCCLSKPVRQSWTGFGKQRLPLRFAAVFLRLSKNKVFRTVSRLKLQFQTKFRYKRVQNPHPFDRFVSQNRAKLNFVMPLTERLFNTRLRRGTLSAGPVCSFDRFSMARSSRRACTRAR